MANSAPYITGRVGLSTYDAATGIYTYDASRNFADTDSVNGDKLTYSLAGTYVYTTIDPDTGIITGDIERSFRENVQTCRNTFDPSVCGGNAACEEFYTRECANCIALEVDAQNALLSTLDMRIVATDSNGASVSMPFSFLTSIVNSAPVPMDDTGSLINLSGTSTGNLLTNDTDPDGDPLNVTAGTQTGSYGILRLQADGTFTYTVEDQNGPEGSHLQEVFQYQVNDGNGGSATASLNLTLNRAPVSQADLLHVQAGREGTGNILTNDLDPDGDTLTVTAIAGGVLGSALRGTYGSLTIGSDGSFTYVADVASSSIPNDVFSDSFTATLTDGFGVSVTTVLSVSVTPTFVSSGGGNGDHAPITPPAPPSPVPVTRLPDPTPQDRFNEAEASAALVRFIEGKNPSLERQQLLNEFALTQYAAYEKAAVLNPALGPYEAIGRAFGETTLFADKYGALTEAAFINSAYTAVFKHSGSSQQIAHFQAQLDYFEKIYEDAGIPSHQADLFSKGAVLGQMIGHASLDLL